VKISDCRRQIYRISVDWGRGRRILRIWKLHSMIWRRQWLMNFSRNSENWRI